MNADDGIRDMEELYGDDVQDGECFESDISYSIVNRATTMSSLVQGMTLQNSHEPFTTFQYWLYVHQSCQVLSTGWRSGAKSEEDRLRSLTTVFNSQQNPGGGPGFDSREVQTEEKHRLS